MVVGLLLGRTGVGVLGVRIGIGVFLRGVQHVCKFSGGPREKVSAWKCAPATARDLESALRKSTSVRTRKMVNNA